MPGFSTRTFFAFADPILRIPTLLYLAGVPADLTPSIRWKDSRASAAGTTANDRARVAMTIFRVIGVHFARRVLNRVL